MFSKFSVKKPYTVFVGVVAVIVLGIVAFTKMVPDLFPSIDLPYAMVMTTYVGASPEEVEETVTRPIEQGMASLNNIENVSSVSSENYSIVIVEFSDSANMDYVTVDMRESLDSIEAQWNDDSIGSPMIMKINPDIMPVMIATLSVKDMSVQEISDYANQTLVPMLEGIDGVASISTSGLIEENINVVIRQDKIDKVNAIIKGDVKSTLDDAKDRLTDANDTISDKKKDLEEALKEFNDGMINGSQGITEARFEILKNEISLADGQEALQEKEQELLSGLAEIEAGEQSLNENETAILEGEQQLNEGIAKIDDAISQMDTQLPTLLEAKKQLESTISMLQSYSTGSTTIGTSNPDTILSQIAIMKQLIEQLQLDSSTIKDMPSLLKALQSKLDEVNAGIQTIQTTKPELQSQRAELVSKLEEVTSAKNQMASARVELNNAKAQALQGKEALDQAKAQLQDGSDKLQDGKSQLNEKDAELQNAKDENGKKLNDGLDAINQAQDTIKDQLDSWDDTVEDALDKASVSDTITVDMVSQILQAENFSMPSGYVTEDGVDYLVRVGDKVEDLDQLKDLVLFDLNIDGVDPITLSDVADVFITDNSDKVYASINGEDGVILSFQKQTGYSTAEVSESIQNKFDDITSDNEDVSFCELMNQGDYINLIVDSVIQNLLEGAVFAIIVLFIFLKDFRPTLIIACSIPISLMFAIVLMYFSGITLNIISLSGLAIGVGMLVDNSIVVIENIYRLKNNGHSAVKSSVNGAKQVAGAVTSSTLTTICVFAPIVFVDGLTKQLFTDMALTIAYSLVASLIVSLTLVPAMTSRMFKDRQSSPKATSNATKKVSIFEKLQNVYGKAIGGALKFKPLVLILVLVILVTSTMAELSRGFIYMPEMDSTQITITLEMPQGSVLKDTVAMSQKVIEQVKDIDDVDTVGAMLSSGTASMFGMSSSDSTTSVSMYAILKDDKKRSSQDIAKQINETFQDYDCTIEASGSSMDMSALGGSGVTINITGSDLDTLQDLATQVSDKISNVEGISEVDNGMDNPTKELKITVDKEKAMLNGLTVAQVYMEIAKDISNQTTATQITMDDKSYSVIVQDGSTLEATRDSIKNHKFTVPDNDAKDEEEDDTKKDDDSQNEDEDLDLSTLEDLQSMSANQTEDTPTKEIKLTDIATVEDTYTLSSINRSSQKRYISVSGTVDEDHNVTLVTSDVEQAIKDIEVPDGYSIEFDGENETIMEAIKQLGLMLVLAILLIYLIMVAQFQSLKSPFIVMFTLPLAFTGGFIALLLSGNELSVIAMIGFVMLSGIVVNNGIVLVDCINQNRLEGMEKREAIIEAGKTRLRPILMTAITTILGLIMMAIGNGMGSDMIQPVAIVTIGGLVYATFTTLFIIPIIYDIFNKKDMVKIDQSEFEYIDD